MFLLVTGGNGSGKSRFAEKVASGFLMPRFYYATMLPYGEEGTARVQKHLRQREGLNFTTVECPYGPELHNGALPVPSLGLLEDASNLLANLTFGEKACSDPLSETLKKIRELSKHHTCFIVVTIGGLKADDKSLDEATAAYVRNLNTLNAQLAELADGAVEMKDGSPVWLKGEKSQWSC